MAGTTYIRQLFIPRYTEVRKINTEETLKKDKETGLGYVRVHERVQVQGTKTCKVPAVQSTSSNTSLCKSLFYLRNMIPVATSNVNRLVCMSALFNNREACYGWGATFFF